MKQGSLKKSTNVMLEYRTFYSLEEIKHIQNAYLTEQKILVSLHKQLKKNIKSFKLSHSVAKLQVQ